MNFLENRLTRPFSLILSFLVSMTQGIYKICLYFPHYVIVVMANWSWHYTIKESCLLCSTSYLSYFIISMEALSQTNNIKALSKLVTFGVASWQVDSMASQYRNLDWELIYRKPWTLLYYRISNTFIGRNKINKYIGRFS